MIKPEVLSPDDDTRLVATVFDAPLVTKDWSWIPLTQVVTWLIMAWQAGRQHPERDLVKRLEIGGLTMSILLGSEWCHNLAHAAVAKWVGKPVDAIRVNLGMPLLVYYDLEDPGVSPRQHIWRALGGPLINACLLVVSTSLRPFTRPGSPARDTVDTAKGMNLFLLLAGLLPQPWLDGGVVLKWALVARGQSLESANKAVQITNAATAVGLGTASATAFKKQRKFWGWLLGVLAALSAGAATGWLKEKAE